MNRSQPSSVPYLRVPEPLGGVLRALDELLTLALPGQATAAAIRERAAWEMAQVAGFEPPWVVATAARLAHLGLVAHGTGATDEGAAALQEAAAADEELLHFYPQVGARILQHVKGLEEVATLVGYQNSPQDVEDPRLRKGAEIVRAAIRLERVFANRASPSQGAGTVEGRFQREAQFDAHAHRSAPPASGTGGADTSSMDERIEEVRVLELQPYMVTAEPIRDREGRILLAKGYRLSPRVIAHLLQVAERTGVQEPVKVLIPEVHSARSMPPPEAT